MLALFCVIFSRSRNRPYKSLIQVRICKYCDYPLHFFMLPKSHGVVTFGQPGVMWDKLYIKRRFNAHFRHIIFIPPSQFRGCYISITTNPSRILSCLAARKIDELSPNVSPRLEAATCQPWSTPGGLPSKSELKTERREKPKKRKPRK